MSWVVTTPESRIVGVDRHRFLVLPSNVGVVVEGVVCLHCWADCLAGQLDGPPDRLGDQGQLTPACPAELLDPLSVFHRPNLSVTFKPEKNQCSVMK